MRIDKGDLYVSRVWWNIVLGISRFRHFLPRFFLEIWMFDTKKYEGKKKIKILMNEIIIVPDQTLDNKNDFRK